MVSTIEKCSECGADVNVRFGQVGKKEHLSWFRTWDCTSCSFHVEEDGDETPEDIRIKVLELEGRWSINISEEDKKSSSFKVLKDVLKLSMKDIAQVRKSSKGLVFSGTQEEANFYLRRCKEFGLELSICKE